MAAANPNSSEIREYAEKHTVLPPVSGWEIFRLPRRQGARMALVLRSKSCPDPYVHEFDRQQLLDLARYLLRSLDPTTQDEILATLQRIESRLSEREQRFP